MKVVSKQSCTLTAFMILNYNLKNSQDFRFNYYRSLWSFNVFILSRVFLNVYRIREIKVKKKKRKKLPESI